MKTRTTIGAVAATLAVLAAGCSSGPSSSAVAWTDKVCGALLGFTDAVSTQPDINPTDPVAAVKGLSQFLGTATTALQGSISGLDAAGPSPVSGGDQIVTSLKSTLTQFQTTFQTAKQKIDAVDTSNPASLVSALPAAVAPLQELSNVPDPTADLKNNAELNAAAEQAPNCQKVRSSAGG